MCPWGEQGGDIMTHSGEGGALLCTAKAPKQPPGIQPHQL